MNYPIDQCVAIILAAGRSSRMGSPKQLLLYKGKTLLEHSIDEAKTSDVTSVLVVLGSEAGHMMTEANIWDAEIVDNENWASGMASSIIAGIKVVVSERPDADAVILMVCDQPYVDSALLNQIIAKQQESDQPIVACEYEGALGVPALFHKFLFSQLLGLEGDAGAKKLINQNLNLVATVPFPSGHIDVDTPEAYEKLT
jgi:molybdenum cofactor cytidylyltransferase